MRRAMPALGAGPGQAVAIKGGGRWFAAMQGADGPEQSLVAACLTDRWRLDGHGSGRTR